MQSDEEVQKAARNLFKGVAPERNEELAKLWQQYQPRFNILTNAGPDGLFVLDAGAYRDVRFNHRAMRAFWLASFIAWEGYRAFSEASDLNNIDFCRFNQMVDCFRKLLTEDDPESIPLPDNVPEPGVYLDSHSHPQLRASAELATFAVGWAFLHEIRHLKHQQDGTSTLSGASDHEKHKEEFSCDDFATRFLLERVDHYAASYNEPEEQVRLKREIGIYFAVFAMTLSGVESWEASDTHPAMQDRIDAVIRLMGSRGTQLSDAIAHTAFAALWNRFPDAPGPFKQVQQR